MKKQQTIIVKLPLTEREWEVILHDLKIGCYSRGGKWITWFEDIERQAKREIQKGYKTREAVLEYRQQRREERERRKNEAAKIQEEKDNSLQENEYHMDADGIIRHESWFEQYGGIHEYENLENDELLDHFGGDIDVLKNWLDDN